MPKSVSKKQYRLMMAIAHGKEIDHPRGTPPKEVAEKYTSPDKDAPEQSGQNRGGDWNKHKSKKKKKEEVKKSFQQYYKGQGVGIVVTNDKGQVLVGKGDDNKWQTPGGHVDPGEDYIEAAHRELREEANIVSKELRELGQFRHNGNDCKVFHVTEYSGKPRSSEELKDLTFADLHSLLDWDLRDCSAVGLKLYAESALRKSSNLKDMLALEKLEKNILRGDGRSTVLDVSHGDALRLVGNGCFRFLQNAVKDMSDEDFKDVHLDTYVISIRKHMNDIYSGRISDGHKVVHQFTNKSLPQLCADVMSVFEWYSDKDEHVFDILDEANLPNDAIEGGLYTLMDNYKRHNLANIYTEMENIRSEIRNGAAIDLQQVESKLMQLFDKLEESIQMVADKHNTLARDAGDEISTIENKLKELQFKVDELSSKPSTVEGYRSRPVNPDRVYDNHYMYLPKPKIDIQPNGKLTITFEKDWTDMEKSNFLNDLKIRLIKK